MVARRHNPAVAGLSAAVAVLTAVALLAVLGRAAAAQPSASAAAGEIRIGYLTKAIPDALPAAAGLPAAPEDEGLQGARLGIDDNNTTGRFSGQRFVLDERLLPADGDVAAAARELAAAGIHYLVADLRGDGLDALLAEPAVDSLLVFNAGAADDRFRNADCRPFLLHTIPSRGMLADALAQYLVKKNWTRWMLIAGHRPEDKLYAEAVQRAAKRFGGYVVAERSWASTHDARRTAQEEVPILTQGERYDVLIVADEAGAFGDYLMYRTWDPRPVAGTQGLIAAGWLPTQEQWGAVQLQSRFAKRAMRPMLARDYAAWAAVRSVGEAATRTRSAAASAIEAWVRGPEFELAAFKGRKLSYRPWDGQLRQPIPLGWARALVTVSPQEGFLHQVTELDTLGYDAPESGCKISAKAAEPK